MYGKRFERELGVDYVADQLIAVFELTRVCTSSKLSVNVNSRNPPGENQCRVRM